MKNYAFTVLLFAAAAAAAASDYAEDGRLIFRLDSGSTESYCIYENKIYSEGSVYRSGSGKSYVCFRQMNEGGKAESAARLVWKEAKEAAK